MNIYTLILCGGVGARLWPLSRKLLPKQFARILKGQTLFERTALRNSQLGAQILIASNRDQRFLAENQLDQLGLTAAGGLIEPVGRNTAPAVALSALQLNSDDILVVCPSDHVIRKDQAYIQTMELGIHLASQGYLVTFGIKPEYPETGYGYIEAGHAVEVSDSAATASPKVLGGSAQSSHQISSSALQPALVAAFHEKPNQERAQQYLESGKYFWNSGMFAFTAGSFLEELQTHSPQAYQACLQAWQHQGSPKLNQGQERGQSTQKPSENQEEQGQSTTKQSFTKPQTFEPTFADMESIPADSIDYAVMEKTKKAVVIPCDLGWSDLGSLEALGEYLDNLDDPAPNVSTNTEASPNSVNLTKTTNTIDAGQEPIVINGHGNLILGDHRQIALIDIDDTMVIETPDALLVAKRGSGQKVKQVVDLLAQQAPQYTQRFPRVERPWGDYTTLEVQPGRTIRTITLKPGWSTSLHYHQHRTETWTITQGAATINLAPTISVTQGQPGVEHPDKPEKSQKPEKLGTDLKKMPEKMSSVPLQVGQTFTVLPNQPHRIENRGTEHLKIVEIQLVAQIPTLNQAQSLQERNQEKRPEKLQEGQTSQIDDTDIIRIADPQRIG